MHWRFRAGCVNSRPSSQVGSKNVHIRLLPRVELKPKLLSEWRVVVLESTAQSSNNQANERAYAAFLSCPLPARKAILDRVVIIDKAPTVNDLDQVLRNEVFWAVDRKFLEPFLQRLEGWWLRRALKQLVAIAQGDRILAQEIEATDVRSA